MEHVVSYLGLLAFLSGLYFLVLTFVRMLQKRSVGFALAISLASFLLSVLLFWYVYFRNVLAVSYGI
jgi:hypothetical protein